MKTMTAENLQSALAGESQAHIKYLAFAAQANHLAKHAAQPQRSL